MGRDVYKTSQIIFRLFLYFFFLTLSEQIQIGLTYRMIELDFKLNKSNKTNLPTRENGKSES